jgi:DNA-binding NarL/FixJ family response regulator
LLEKAMNTKKRVLIAENHQVFREELSVFLSHNENLQVVAEAGDGLEALRLIERHLPDLVLLDLSMPRLSGIGVLKEVKTRFPEIKALALTIHESGPYVLEAFQKGADGYCLKDAAREELVIAIDCVLSGKPFISPAIAAKVLHASPPYRRHIRAYGD